VLKERDRKDRLLDAALELTSDLSLPVVLQRIVDLAADLTGARYAALGVLGPGQRITEFVTSGLSGRQRKAIGTLPTGRGILGALISDARPLRLRRIADDPRSVGFPPHHPPMTSFLGVPVRAGGRVYGNLYLTNKRDAEQFTEDDEASLVILATQAGVAVANAYLYQETSRREAWLQALSEITQRMLAGAEPETLLPAIAANARELAGADTAAIVTPLDGGSRLAIAHADGAGADRLRGVAVPLDRSLAAEVMRNGRPLVSEDAASDPRTSSRINRLARMGPVVCVPLRMGGKPIGSLWVSRLSGRPPFEDSTVQLVESFAAQASVALESGRTRRELERLAVLEDRERIAKELHDGIIQSLFAVGMGLQATASQASDPQIDRRVDAAIAELDRVIRDLRNYIFGLRPGLLADRQLDQALREVVSDFEARSGMAVALELDGGVTAELSPRAADVLQMAREALSNAGRHSGARQVRLSLKRQRLSTAALTVADNGSGFDADRGRAEGQGLRNLRERALALGGELQLDTAPGRGTIVRVRLPLGTQ